MAKWNVEVKDVAVYFIEAATEEEAARQVHDWWVERNPTIVVTKINEKTEDYSSVFFIFVHFTY